MFYKVYMLLPRSKILMQVQENPNKYVNENIAWLDRSIIKDHIIKRYRQKWVEHCFIEKDRPCRHYVITNEKNKTKPEEILNLIKCSGELVYEATYIDKIR